MELKIEKWIYGGEGLARMAPDESGRGKAVFVPFVLPGEVVEASLTEQKSGFARAKLETIVQASPSRVEPPCQYFYRCGGCQYQHADYEKQLQWKADILLETLQRTAKITPPGGVVLHSGEPYQYRNRTRLKVRSGPEFAIGYHRLGTNELLPVTECPISSPLIQRGLQAAWRVGKKAVACEGLREIQFFADDADKSLLVELYIERAVAPRTLESFARALREEMAEIAGVTVFPWSAAEDDEDRVPAMSLKSADGLTFGQGNLQYETAHGSFRVSAGSFFQTNRFLVDELVNTALGDAKGRAALDLYAGTGLFSVPLAEHFDRVTAVEASRFSYADLRINAPMVKSVESTTEKYLENMGKSRGLDLVLLDPPRSGMGERTARMLAATQVPRITYVSCDPATLARDLRVLTAAGYQLQDVHLVDLFPQTFHMETVVHLGR